MGLGRDNIYDVYGTLDELKIFTHAVERWDIKAMEQLSDYMKVCYLALFNTTNDMTYHILKRARDQCLALPHKTMGRFMQSLLKRSNMAPQWIQANTTRVLG